MYQLVIRVVVFSVSIEQYHCAPKLLRSSAQLNCSVDMERNSRSSSSSRRSNAEQFRAAGEGGEQPQYIVLYTKKTQKSVESQRSVRPKNAARQRPAIATAKNPVAKPRHYHQHHPDHHCDDLKETILYGQCGRKKLLLCWREKGHIQVRRSPSTQQSKFSWWTQFTLSTSTIKSGPFIEQQVERRRERDTLLGQREQQCSLESDKKVHNLEQAYLGLII